MYEGHYFYNFPVNYSHPKGLGGASGSPVLNAEDQVVGVAFLGGTNEVTVTKLKNFTGIFSQGGKG